MRTHLRVPVGGPLAVRLRRNGKHVHDGSEDPVRRSQVPWPIPS